MLGKGSLEAESNSGGKADQGESDSNGGKTSGNLSAGGGPCLQFIKNATPVKHNKAKYNKTRYAYNANIIQGKEKSWKKHRGAKDQSKCENSFLPSKLCQLVSF